MKNFDVHVISNLPQYEEIKWENKPLPNETNKLDKHDYIDGENDNMIKQDFPKMGKK